MSNRRDFLKKGSLFMLSGMAVGNLEAQQNNRLEHKQMELGAKVVRHNGILKIQINQEVFEPLAFRSFRPETRNIQDFHKAGIKLMSILHTGLDCTLDVPYSPFGEIWTGPGEYDFKAFDKQMDLFLKNAPDAYFNIMLQLDTRDWYLKMHPEYSNSYWNLVEMAGYEPWRKDTATYLKDMLQYIEGKYGDRVFAYSLFCGGSTEWYTNSQGRNRKAARLRYHNIKEKCFREFIGNPDETLPVLPELYRTSNGVFRHPQKEEKALAYWKFHHEIIGDSILYFASQAQEVIQHRKLIGLYYGYLNTLKGRRLLEEGHLGYEKVWKSKDIDMIFQPARYGGARKFNGASGYLSTVDSLDINNKLTFQEIDHTTFIAPTHVENGRKIPGHDSKLKDRFETRMVLRREFILTRVKRTALWWFDFFGGYYYDQGLMDEVSDIIKVQKKLENIPMKSVAEIAVFGDINSMYYPSALSKLSDDLLCKPPDELARIGAPFDIYSTFDLENPELPLDQYKMIVFLNAMKLDDKRKAFINKHLKKKGRTILWIYANDYIQEDGFSTESMSETIGMQVGEHDGVKSTIVVQPKDILSEINEETKYGFSDKLFPLFRIDDPEAKTLGNYENQEVPALGYKTHQDYTSFFSASANIPSSVYRAIARHAGVHIYYEGNNPVYINNRLVGIHFQNDEKQEINLKTTKPVNVEDLFDGGTYKTVDGKLNISKEMGLAKLYLILS